MKKRKRYGHQIYCSICKKTKVGWQTRRNGPISLENYLNVYGDGTIVCRNCS